MIILICNNPDPIFSIDNGRVQSGRRLRLPVQGGPDRRLRRGKVESAVPFHPKRIQPGDEIDDRRGVRDAEHSRGRQDREGPDLGHGGARKVRGFRGGLGIGNLRI